MGEAGAGLRPILTLPNIETSQRSELLTSLKLELTNELVYTQLSQQIIQSAAHRRPGQVSKMLRV